MHSTLDIDFLEKCLIGHTPNVSVWDFVLTLISTKYSRVIECYVVDSFEVISMNKSKSKANQKLFSIIDYNRVTLSNKSLCKIVEK